MRATVLHRANICIAGRPAPARAYIEKLLPDVLEGNIKPGRVFDRVIGLEEVPDGYRAMNDRAAIKVMIDFRCVSGLTTSSAGSA
jgi:threonine dehydrogenase-like Zn-dependent dehydrogenase